MATPSVPAGGSATPWGLLEMSREMHHPSTPRVDTMTSPTAYPTHRGEAARAAGAVGRRSLALRTFGVLPTLFLLSPVRSHNLSDPHGYMPHDHRHTAAARPAGIGEVGVASLPRPPSHGGGARRLPPRHDDPGGRLPVRPSHAPHLRGTASHRDTARILRRRRGTVSRSTRLAHPDPPRRRRCRRPREHRRTPDRARGAARSLCCGPGPRRDPRRP